MRKIPIYLFAVACIMLMAIPAFAEERQVSQHHSIEIEVECLVAATEIIRGLNGHNLESSVFLNESEMHGAERWGFIVRRVDGWAFRHVQDVLRGLGEVHFESESGHSVRAQIVDADVRIAALSQEIERLSLMMAASDSLPVLIAIDARLGEVTRERNHIIGMRNMLMAQAANPVINITLFETPVERPPAAPPRFGSRVANSFMASLRGTMTAAGHLLVFLVRISIPALVYGVLAVSVFLLYVKYDRKQAAKRALAAADGPEIAAPDGVDTLVDDAKLAENYNWMQEKEGDQ